MRRHLQRYPVTREWHFAGKAFIEQTCQRIDVGAGIDDVAHHSFGGHVCPRSGGAALGGQFGAGTVLGQAEIDQVDESLIGHQGVGWFNVPVHQPMGVGGIQSGCDLFDHSNGSRRSHGTVALERDLEVNPVDDRHYQVQLAVNFAGVVDGDDVRVGQPSRDESFPAEPRAKTRLVGPIGRQDFDRHVASHNGVVRLIYRACSTLSDELEQPISTEFPGVQLITLST